MEHSHADLKLCYFPQIIVSDFKILLCVSIGNRIGRQCIRLIISICNRIEVVGFFYREVRARIQAIVEIDNIIGFERLRIKEV